MSVQIPLLLGFAFFVGLLLGGITIVVRYALVQNRWKGIAMKATYRADRLDLALENIAQNDPGLVDHAIEWATAQMQTRPKP